MYKVYTINIKHVFVNIYPIALKTFLMSSSVKMVRNLTIKNLPEIRTTVPFPFVSYLCGIFRSETI